MPRSLAHRGAKFTLAYARAADGSHPAKEFVETLAPADQMKVVRLFVAACETGDFSNGEKYGDLGNGMREFKCHQIRIPFTYCTKQRGMIVATHGFVKKQNKAPKQEIARAWRIFMEDQSTLPDPPKLELIQGKKR